MSRSNTRSAAGRRKPGTDGAVKPLLRNETVTQRAQGKKTRHVRKGPVDMPDVVQAVMVDIDTLLDRQAEQDILVNGIARRRIEMLREAQWLQRQLAESYDP